MELSHQAADTAGGSVEEFTVNVLKTHLFKACKGQSPKGQRQKKEINSARSGQHATNQRPVRPVGVGGAASYSRMCLQVECRSRTRVRTRSVDDRPPTRASHNLNSLYPISHTSLSQEGGGTDGRYPLIRPHVY